MKTNIGGITDISTIDWPGHVCSVIFFRGCNMDCWYCHNKEFLSGENCVENDEIFNQVAVGNKGLIDAVVISGGECTLQDEALVDLCSKFKDIGLKVAIQTNGSDPFLIEMMVMNGLVDKVFVDMKTFMHYNFTSWTEFIGMGGVEIEFRRTVFNAFNDGELNFLAFKGEKVLQQGIYKDRTPLNRDELMELAKKYGYTAIRTREGGYEKVCL